MRRRAASELSLLFTVLLLPAIGCDGATGSQPRASGPHGVVLVSVDGYVPSEVAVYGGAVAVPGLSKLAAQGVVFDDAVTVSPSTRPALASLLTGIAPDRSEVRDDALDALPAGVPTLAELYRKAGRTTAAFVTSITASHFTGLERGFEVFDGPERPVGVPVLTAIRPHPSAEAADHFAEWLVTVPSDRPYFAWVHLAEMENSTVDARYDSPEKGIATTREKVDAALARILTALDARGAAERTEVVFVGTHGEARGRGGVWGARYWLIPETVRVPLVWKRAGAKEAGERRDARRVWLPDVARSLAVQIGASLDASAEGADLFASTGPFAERTRYAWTWAPDDRAAWPTVTYADAPGGAGSFEWPELQGSQAAGPSPALAAAKARPAVPRERRLPADARAKIEKAGIRLGSGAPMPLPPRMVRDAFLVDLEWLELAIAEERFPRIRALRAKMLEKLPNAYGVLLAALQRSALRMDPAEARKYAEPILVHYPDRYEALHWAAHVELLEKATPRAEALLEAANEMRPGDPDVLYDLACARALSGDSDRAIDYLNAAIQAGFHEWEAFEKDTDLASVRSDPRFAKLMETHGR